MNKTLKFFLIFNSLFVFASGLLGPLYAIYVENIDNRVLAVSSSWTAFLISATLCTFLMSKIGDKLKLKVYFLTFGYVIRSIVWFSYIFVGSLSFLIILQIILGVGEALGSPSFDAIFAEHLDKNKHITDYADWKVLVYLSSALSTFFGGIIVASYGFTPLFLLMSLLAMASSVGLILLRNDLV